jgi:glycine oxidase
MLAPAAEARGAERELIDFALENCAYFPEFVSEIERISGVDCDYRENGTLLVALNNDDRLALTHVEPLQKEFGLSVEWLSGKEARKLEPFISPRVIGALWARNDKHVNPRALHRALLKAFESEGGKVIVSDEYPRILQQADGIRGASCASEGKEVKIPAEQVVVAAGAWTNDILGEDLRLPMRPILGQYIRLIGEEVLEHVVRTPDVYLVPRAGGELFVGASAEDMGFTLQNTAGVIGDLLQNAWRACPAVSELKIEEVAVGFRPALRDNLPAMGQWGPKGLFVATGHFRHGVMLAPLSGRLVADIMLGKGDGQGRKAFDPKRFSGGKATELQFF